MTIMGNFNIFLGASVVFLILPGLLSNILVWNRGYWRAFAAGASVRGWLAFLLFSLLTGLFGQTMNFNRLAREYLRTVSLLSGVTISGSIVSGLIGTLIYIVCAGSAMLPTKSIK